MHEDKQERIITVIKELVTVKQVEAKDIRHLCKDCLPLPKFEKLLKDIASGKAVQLPMNGEDIDIVLADLEKEAGHTQVIEGAVVDLPAVNLPKPGTYELIEDTRKLTHQFWGIIVVSPFLAIAELMLWGLASAVGHWSAGAQTTFVIGTGINSVLLLVAYAMGAMTSLRARITDWLHPLKGTMPAFLHDNKRGHYWGYVRRDGIPPEIVHRIRLSWFWPRLRAADLQFSDGAWIGFNPCTMPAKVTPEQHFVQMYKLHWQRLLHGKLSWKRAIPMIMLVIVIIAEIAGLVVHEAIRQGNKTEPPKQVQPVKPNVQTQGTMQENK